MMNNENIYDTIIQGSSFLHEYGFSVPIVFKQENGMYTSLLYKNGDGFGIEIFYELYPCFAISIYLLKLKNGKTPSGWNVSDDGKRQRILLTEFLNKYNYIQATTGNKKNSVSFSDGRITESIDSEIKRLKDNINIIIENRESLFIT